MYNKCCDGRFHTIKKGDTLYSLARMYNIPLIMLLKANPFIDVYNMQIGEKVCIPIKCDLVCNEIPVTGDPPKTFAYVIMPGESLNDILIKYKITIEDILEFNKPEDLVMKPGIAIMLPIEAMNGQSDMTNVNMDGMGRRDFMRESVGRDNMERREYIHENIDRDDRELNRMHRNNIMSDEMIRDDMMRDEMMRSDMMREVR